METPTYSEDELRRIADAARNANDEWSIAAREVWMLAETALRLHGENERFRDGLIEIRDSGIKGAAWIAKDTLESTNE